VDPGRRRALWTDTRLPSTGGFPSTGSYGGGGPATVERDLWDRFGSGSRTTLWDLGVRRAAALSAEVAVMSREPEPARRWPDEDAAAFAVRVSSMEDSEEPPRTPALTRQRPNVRPAGGCSW
jgi:hypothetical protein